MHPNPTTTAPTTNTSPTRRHASTPITAATAANAVSVEGNELFGGCGNSGVKCIATNGLGRYVRLPTSWLANCVNPSPSNAATPGRNRPSQTHIKKNPTGHRTMKPAVPQTTIGVTHGCATAKSCSAADDPSMNVCISNSCVVLDAKLVLQHAGRASHAPP